MQRSNKLVIGIYISAEVSDNLLDETLYHLYLDLSLSGDLKIEIILLYSYLNQTSSHLMSQANINHILLKQQSSNRPCAFNELIKHDADYYLFLEVGILLAPGCLRQLMNSLQNDPATGIVGPSSNNSWNQQSLYTDKQPRNVNILRRSNEVRRLHKNKSEPIAGLIENFFIVSVLVVEAIGHADEKYKNGYCWELDYHKRAELAGFSCLWVKSAYAHRSHQVNDELRADSHIKNARRYQRKFADANNNASLFCGRQDTNEQYPLISCIMPTKARSQYVAQAIIYFNRQTYPNTELIIVYEESSDLPVGIQQFSNIHTVKSCSNSSIGHKRNKALGFSCGDIIVHWDDDDWYANNRLSEQAKPLLDNSAEISALYNTCFFVPVINQAWCTTDALYSQLFIEGVIGGTLMYKTEIIGRSQFLEISLREDAVFLEELMAKDARLAKVDGRSLFVYIRHDNNTWKFTSGTHMSPNDWLTIDISDLFAQDLDFYLSFYVNNNHSPMTDHKLGSQGIHSPKVSCIMPTNNRRHFVSQAIDYFFRQSYSNKELIIVDDGDDPIDDLISPQWSNIKYIQLEEKMTVGCKRNIAIDNANGDIIMHWDDDDWIADTWVEVQVNALLDCKADIVGINQVLYYCIDSGLAWQYRYSGSMADWALGGSLCYFKKHWSGNKFSALNVGEDTVFLSVLFVCGDLACCGAKVEPG